MTTPLNPAQDERSARTRIIKQAIIMIATEDLCGWSDAHDAVTIEALNGLLHEEETLTQEQEKP